MPNTFALPVHAGAPAGGVRELARRRPITALLIVLLVPVYLAYAIVLLTGLPFMIGQVAELVFLLVAPTLASAWIGGRHEVGHLYSGLLRWRWGVRRWLVVLLALPVLSLPVALATGTLSRPTAGWLHQGLTYGIFLVGGALSANVWEETAWTGFVQSRLMERHGLLAGSLLTAVPFGVIHLPLAFHAGLRSSTARDVVLTWAFMLALAPFMRLLLGMVFLDTSGSTLAVGLLHASLNATMAATVLDGGGWQALVALIALTLAVAAWRNLHRAARTGLDPQEL